MIKIKEDSINKFEYIEVEFGNGDIGISVSTNKEYKAIALNELTEENEIGSCSDEKHSDKPPIVLKFNKKESVDILINQLNKIKEMFE